MARTMSEKDVDVFKAIGDTQQSTFEALKLIVATLENHERSIETLGKLMHTHKWWHFIGNRP